MNSKRNFNVKIKNKCTNQCPNQNSKAKQSKTFKLTNKVKHMQFHRKNECYHHTTNNIFIVYMIVVLQS